MKYYHLVFLATHAGQLLNYNNLSSDLGLSAVTIKSWIHALEASNIIYTLKPFYKNLGKRLIKTPKIYFMDSGLLCYLMGFRSSKELKHSNLLGALFENFVLGQIVRKESNKGKKRIISKNIFSSAKESYLVKDCQIISLSSFNF